MNADARFAPCMPLTGSKGWPPTAQIARRALVAYLVALGAPSAMALSGLPCAVCGGHQFEARVISASLSWLAFLRDW